MCQVRNHRRRRAFPPSAGTRDADGLGTAFSRFFRLKLESAEAARPITTIGRNPISSQVNVSAGRRSKGPGHEVRRDSRNAAGGRISMGRRQISKRNLTYVAACQESPVDNGWEAGDGRVGDDDEARTTFRPKESMLLAKAARYDLDPGAKPAVLPDR